MLYHNKAPHLCNYYCSHECPIGQEFVPDIEIKDLAQITLETLASLNAMDKTKKRLIEVTADGEITEDEYEDFAKIQKQLDQISMAVDSLQLWVNKTITEGKNNKDSYEAIKK